MTKLYMETSIRSPARAPPTFLGRMNLQKIARTTNANNISQEGVRHRLGSRPHQEEANALEGPTDKS